MSEYVSQQSTLKLLTIIDASSLLVHCCFLQWDNPGLVVVAYDASMEQSFDSCVKWLERVRAQKPAVETQLPGHIPSSFAMSNCS